MTDSTTVIGKNTRTLSETGGFSKFNKVGVVGMGMVGAQVYAWFKENNILPVAGYDIHQSKSANSLEEVYEADLIFVCVPTPYKENEEYDLSKLEKAISSIPDGKIVVIKSTVNPGTTDRLQSEYPNKTFIFNPEFLTELTAKEDFFKPDMQILGVPYQGYKIASALMQILPKAPVMQIISPVDAEWVKKFRNAFYATKVIFFNQMYDIIQKTFPADYETIRSVVVQDPRIGNSHSFIFHKNSRGFGGMCLPKDSYSLIDFAKRVGAPSELLEIVRKLNFHLNGGKK